MPRRYKSTSLEDRLSIIRRAKAGEKLNVLAAEYSLHSSSVWNIVNRGQATSENAEVSNKKMKRIKKPEIDPMLMYWFRTHRNAGISIGGELLKVSYFCCFLSLFIIIIIRKKH